MQLCPSCGTPLTPGLQCCLARAKRMAISTPKQSGIATPRTKRAPSARPWATPVTGSTRGRTRALAPARGQAPGQTFSTAMRTQYVRQVATQGASYRGARLQFK